MDPTRRRAARWSAHILLAFGAALCLMLILSAVAFANVVEIHDQANVLDQNQVQRAAASLADPIRIYTVPSYNGTSSDFDKEAVKDINTPQTIVIAINTSAHHLYIAGGRNAGLTSSDYNNAVTAFKNSFGNNNYTAATIAAINSLRDALNRNSGSTGSTGGTTGGTSGGTSEAAPASGSGFNWLYLLCCVVLLIVIAGAIFGRRRGYGGGWFNRSGGYGPGYQQGGGVNPLAAGGLGAAAGGFIGYELGKAEGEREARQDYGGNFGGGDFGGGAGGFFGGDGGGFGGGDFGGGAGGDFGSGDFGGGGDNFGGGSGGNF